MGKGKKRFRSRAYKQLGVEHITLGESLLERINSDSFFYQNESGEDVVIKESVLKDKFEEILEEGDWAGR